MGGVGGGGGGGGVSSMGFSPSILLLCVLIIDLFIHLLILIWRRRIPTEVKGMDRIGGGQGLAERR